MTLYEAVYGRSPRTIYNSDYATTSISDDSLNQLYGSVLEGQKAVWDREDSAYQRMVADMRKAGLNPWSGISSGGLATSSTNPVESALNSLFSGLNYNLDVKKLQYDWDKNKQNNGVKALIALMKLILPALSWSM